MYDQILYPSLIKAAISRIESLLAERPESKMGRRSMALLLLQRDPLVRSQLQHESYFPEIESIVTETQAYFSESLSLAIAESRHQLAMAIEEEVTIQSQQQKSFKHEWLHHLTVHPLTGIPILVLVLYFGIYQFVGVFVGGTLVDGIEGFLNLKSIPSSIK